MKKLKRLRAICLSVLILVFAIRSTAQRQSSNFQPAQCFFPEWKELKSENISWGYLKVPENWSGGNGKSIKLAVAILHSKIAGRHAEPLVFVQGGPGGSTISDLWRWLNHPARQNRDIVLVDLRGTGLSQPTLCPNLGHKFLAVLAGNYSPAQEINERVRLALQCKDTLLAKKIDIAAYNSNSIAKDLHALKICLGYKKWNVYGLSYGTHVAMIYGNEFPDDVNKLILDSPVPPHADYYNNSTSNYIRALNVFFEKCRNDHEANRQYPNLESKYYQTVESLKKNPIEVNVPTNIVSTGKFYFNAQDMMLAIQQGLYSKRIIQVLPLLINAFHDRNKDALGHLVKSLSSRLLLDYGTYYCVLCHEMIPFNSLAKFHEDAAKNTRFPVGLTFYESEFSICKVWNKELKIDSAESMINISQKPTLIFSGDLDPITPLANGILTQKSFPRSYLIEVSSWGHGVSFSECGNKLIASFLDNPTVEPNSGCFKQAGNLKFITHVNLQPGVANIATVLNEANFLAVTPLALVVLILIISVVLILIRLMKSQYSTVQQRVMHGLLCSTTVLFLLMAGLLINAILTTAAFNSYILAFGLPSRFNYLFFLIRCFVLLFAISTFFYFFKMRKLTNKIIPIMIFCLLVCNLYLFFWKLL